MSVHYLHTKLRVRDLERAIRFYEQAFGYELRKRKAGPQESLIAFLALPGEESELQLAFYPTEGPFEVPQLLMHLAYRVNSLDQTLEKVMAAGAQLASTPYTLPSGSRVAFVRDPDGYDIELIQKPAR